MGTVYLTDKALKILNNVCDEYNKNAIVKMDISQAIEYMSKQLKGKKKR